MKEPTLTPGWIAFATLVGALLVVALGVVTSARVATLVLAGGAMLGAALRIALPADRGFSVRRRAVDVALLLVIATALAFLGLTTPLD